MDVGSFLVALLTDWVALLSGSASVILSILGVIRKKELPRWVWWTAAIICLLLASARVWTTEHRRAESLQITINTQLYPQFSCTINQVSNFAKESFTHASSDVLLIVTLRNTGAPSAVEESSMKVILMDGTEVVGLPLSVPDGFSVKYPNGFTRTLKSDEALYNKAVKSVGHNEIVRGYLMYQFSGLSDERLLASTKSEELYVKDVYGKTVSCSSKPDQSGPGTVLDFPGIDNHPLK